MTVTPPDSKPERSSSVTAAVGRAVALVPVLTAVAYAVLSEAYENAYFILRVSPAEVGVTQIDVLTRAGTALLVTSANLAIFLFLAFVAGLVIVSAPFAVARSKKVAAALRLSHALSSRDVYAPLVALATWFLVITLVSENTSRGEAVLWSAGPQVRLDLRLGLLAVEHPDLILTIGVAVSAVAVVAAFVVISLRPAWAAARVIIQLVAGLAAATAMAAFIGAATVMGMYQGFQVMTGNAPIVVGLQNPMFYVAANCVHVSPAADTAIDLSHPVLYLGGSEGLTVLYDQVDGGPLRVPTGTVLLSAANPDDCIP